MLQQFWTILNSFSPRHLREANSWFSNASIFLVLQVCANMHVTSPSKFPCPFHTPLLRLLQHLALDPILYLSHCAAMACFLDYASHQTASSLKACAVSCRPLSLQHLAQRLVCNNQSTCFLHNEACTETNKWLFSYFLFCCPIKITFTCPTMVIYMHSEQKQSCICNHLHFSMGIKKYLWRNKFCFKLKERKAGHTGYLTKVYSYN